MIQSFEFGKIVIDGQEYTHDIMITPDGQVHKWWRKEGHLVSLDDLKLLLDDPPKLLIVGAGTNGMMSFPDSLKDYLREKGIEVTYERTNRAVELFNQCDQSQKKKEETKHDQYSSTCRNRSKRYRSFI